MSDLKIFSLAFGHFSDSAACLPVGLNASLYSGLAVAHTLPKGLLQFNL